MSNVIYETGVVDWWRRGYLGQGVDVAVIDSGVAPLSELTSGSRWINGPDLSFDRIRHVGRGSRVGRIDAYGHGTHIAGIIAGKDVHLRDATAW